MMEKTYEPAVQGLRGAAAMSVLIVHLYDMPMLAGFLPAVPSWFNSAISTGGRGVELFFMISGYLIPASLVRHASIVRFFRDRCLRILPVFVIFHLILFVVGPLVGYKFFRDIDVYSYIKLFLANLFFLTDIVNLPTGQQNAWTLTYEWLFYFWFAAIFYFGMQRHILIGVAALLIVGLAAIFYFPISAYFLVGVAIRHFDVRLRMPGLGGLIAGLTCWALMYACLEYINPLLGLLPGFILFAMVLAPISGVSIVLAKPTMQYVGKISYSLYLVHPFALFPLQWAGAKLAGQGYSHWALWTSFVVLGLLASFSLAILTYELVEVRLTRRVAACFRPCRLQPANVVAVQAAVTAPPRGEA
jgi:peptidoglycan/LPS O-acetylase OafA/YrhL